MLQDNNMDNKLQQLENQRLPDLSHMDKHWAEMEAMLQDNNKPAGGVFSLAGRKLLGWVAAVAALVTLFFGGRYYLNSNKGNDAVVVNDAVPLKNNIISKDSSEKDTVSVTIQQFNNSTIKPPAISFTGHYTSKNNHNVTINFYPCDSSGVISTSNLPDSVKIAFKFREREEMNQFLMTEFMSRLQKEPNRFSIDNRFDTLIRCAEGTTIQIPAGVFSNTNDRITIEVSEYYAYADMIANKLNTLSNGQPLVSDGMLSIRAMQGGKEIQMNGITPMNIKMPRRDENPEMQLFTGEWKDLANTVAVPAFTNNSNRQLNWIAQGQWQRGLINDVVKSKRLEPYLVKKKWFSDKVIQKYSLKGYDTLSFEEAKKMIREDNPGEDFIIRLKRGRPNPLGFRFLNKRAYVITSQQNAAYINRPFMVTGTAGLTGDTITNNAELNRQNKIVSSYSFNVRNTGWINCDRFMNDPSPKVEFTISGNDSNRVYFNYLVFKKMRSVMPMPAINNQCQYSAIPAGADVTLISLGVNNGKMISAIKAMKTASGEIKDLPFEETSPEQFKKKISALDF